MSTDFITRLNDAWDAFEQEHPDSGVSRPRWFSVDEPPVLAGEGDVGGEVVGDEDRQSVQYRGKQWEDSLVQGEPDPATLDYDSPVRDADGVPPRLPAERVRPRHERWVKGLGLLRVERLPSGDFAVVPAAWALAHERPRSPLRWRESRPWWRSFATYDPALKAEPGIAWGPTTIYDAKGKVVHVIPARDERQVSAFDLRNARRDLGLVPDTAGEDSAEWKETFGDRYDSVNKLLPASAKRRYRPPAERLPADFEQSYLSAKGTDYVMELLPALTTKQVEALAAFYFPLTDGVFLNREAAELGLSRQAMLRRWVKAEQALIRAAVQRHLPDLMDGLKVKTRGRPGFDYGKAVEHLRWHTPSLPLLPSERRRQR